MPPSSFKKVLIDGDILTYRIGFTTQDVDEGIAKWRLDETLENIMKLAGTDLCQLYLTSADKSNFRFALFPDYKAHRKDKPKPIHYDFLRRCMVEDYMGIMIHGEEADDALGIELTKDPENQILASIDKDLDMIPGWHCNFVKGSVYYINELEGWRNFYWQCLVGDKATDNIEGCPKIGEVKATRSLEGCESEEEMFNRVTGHYLSAYSLPELASEKLWLAGNLLWIRRKPNQVWERPSGEAVSKTRLNEFYETGEWNTNTSPESSNTESQSPSTSTPQTSDLEGWY